jgi:hypothetical protein
MPDPGANKDQRSESATTRQQSESLDKLAAGDPIVKAASILHFAVLWLLIGAYNSVAQTPKTGNIVAGKAVAGVTLGSDVSRFRQVFPKKAAADGGGWGAPFPFNTKLLDFSGSKGTVAR